MSTEREHRPPANPQQAVLRLAPQPIASTDLGLGPGKRRLVLESPGGQHRQGLRQVGIGAPQPQRAGLGSQLLHAEVLDLLERHVRVRAHAAAGGVAGVFCVRPWRIGHDDVIAA